MIHLEANPLYTESADSQVVAAFVLHHNMGSIETDLCAVNLQNPGLFFKRGSLPHTLTHVENLGWSRISCNIMSWHLAHTQDPVNRWLHTRHVCYLLGLGAPEECSVTV
jgi:hypothetical protein